MGRMKFMTGGAVALLVLSISAVAVAGQGASTATPQATFSATAKRVDTKTCQGADGKYTITRGAYTGTFTSSTPSLNGDARLLVRSVYNNDESAGWMQGELWVKGSDPGTGTHARFSAVNLDGNVEGLLEGRSGSPKAGLLANFAAQFDGSNTGGFTAGKLGTGASANEALLFTGGCQSDNSQGKDGHDSSTQQNTNNQNPNPGGDPHHK